MSEPRELKVDGVGWSAKSRTIIDDISFACAPGSVTGIIGPNGSGKTTLLSVVAGLRRPTTGAVWVGEADVHALKGRERARRIALVEQEASTSLDLTVRDVVALGRIPHGSRWRTSGDVDDSDGLLARAMEFAQVDDLADRAWQTLSGGERQRSHLARAIAQEPGVLLLDEPTNHLDLQHQIDFLGRVRELGLTTVAALHDLELTGAFCDQVVVLAGGRLVAAGPVGEVLTDAMIAEVYAVDAVVGPHPVHPRPHVRWNGVLDRSYPVESGGRPQFYKM